MTRKKTDPRTEVVSLRFTPAQLACLEAEAARRTGEDARALGHPVLFGWTVAEVVMQAALKEAGWFDQRRENMGPG